MFFKCPDLVEALLAMQADLLANRPDKKLLAAYPRFFEADFYKIMEAAHSLAQELYRETESDIFINILYIFMALISGIQALQKMSRGQVAALV